ncbi:Meiotically up-regulated 190 protein [Mycena indigotica]|uniref:Meiotically up-regulated 190 protein n=1 Tax=Mycena indigotica TaxID=2126181 RepID=A0A8H6WEQ4_9AGAR|nr:Meiotically up-regulated 190 protein [Mycena indigotica]KAF7309714.1 Meiotically up-regulated 190 protein [Mycena indigotica]
MSTQPSSEGQTPTPDTNTTVHDPVTRSNVALRRWSSASQSSSSNESLVVNGHPDIVQNAQLADQLDITTRKTKIQMAAVAGAGSFVGAVAILMLSRILGSLMNGWTGWAISGVLCCILAVVSASSVLYYWNPPPLAPPIQLDGPENQLHQRTTSPETALWFNAFLGSLWPIINPALFISVSDMLEDALQASLPKFITGVRVADMGQGSQSIEILEIRSLDTDANAKDSDKRGDFVNLEVLLSYHARSHGKSLMERSGNPHILMEFLLTGGVAVPVWIELTGLKVATRMRIQLMPNPPFLSSLILTLLGQPKVTLKCTPMNQKFVNVMDIPVLSGWLQSAIDGAVGAYVAPRSLTLDLKTMLSGREAMDTEAFGVLVVIAKSAVGFRNGDGGKFWESEAERHGDPYVSIGWGKWGKPVWSSRIIENEGNPHWEEIAFLLVGPSEINAKEKLRVQLWDSDRGAADDLLGTVEVNLNELMEDSKTLNRMSSRTDSFTDIEGRKQLPGELRWECGYFAKTSLEQHLAQKGESLDELKADVERQTERELREADSIQKNAKEDIENQKRVKLKDRGDEIIAACPPTDEWPSGILSVMVEQIDGLIVPHPRKSKIGEGESEDQSDHLPNAYCTIILNHQRVFRTRTKLKTNKPYFSASTERFVKDWRTASVMVAVRDQRLHEVDPLIGVVVLPLRTLFEKRSQVSGSYPLTGGIGFGRVKLSLVFRSVQAQLPRSLIGWDVGTLDIQPSARATDNLPSDVSACKLVLRTLNGKGKLHTHEDGWQHERGKPVRLAVKRRYAECLLIEFRKHSVGPDSTSAFSVLWMKDIGDDEDSTVNLPVWRSQKRVLQRAQFNTQEPKDAERLGTLKLKLRLWPGLSGYHKSLADHDPNIADVMKVLDAAEEMLRGDGDSPRDSLYDSVVSSDSEEAPAPEPKTNGGILSEIKDHKKRSDQLHREHRGLMQWGAARKLAWVGHNVEQVAGGLEQKVKGKFKHRQAEQGMDTEA